MSECTWPQHKKSSVQRLRHMWTQLHRGLTLKNSRNEARTAVQVGIKWNNNNSLCWKNRSFWSRKHKLQSDLDKSWDRKLERNVQCVVVVRQRVMLIILDQFNNRRELERLNKPELAVLVKDLYQLIAATFPVNSKSALKISTPKSQTINYLPPVSTGGLVLFLGATNCGSIHLWFC